MLILCYHSGALGHTVSALLDSCTIEKGEFPLFIKDKNLHHYKSKKVTLSHPIIDIAKENELGNTVVSSTSHSNFGKILILHMGIYKISSIEEVSEITEKNYSFFGKNILSTHSYGEKLEILSKTIRDKLTNNGDWFTDVTPNLDILSFWNNTSAVVRFIEECGLAPDYTKVTKFCNLVVETNKKYYNDVMRWDAIVNLIIANNRQPLNLSFHDTVMIHSMLLTKMNLCHRDVKLLHILPTSTDDFINIVRI